MVRWGFSSLKNLRAARGQLPKPWHRRQKKAQQLSSAAAIPRRQSRKWAMQTAFRTFPPAAELRWSSLKARYCRVLRHSRMRHNLADILVVTEHSLKRFSLE